MNDSSAVDPRAVRRVLMIRPRFLGDVCLTLPALDAVRSACPDAKVAYLVERANAPLLEGDPRVDELIVVDRAPGPIATLALLWRLRRFRPEVAFDFFCNPRTAIWCRASGARVRVGYPFKGWRSSLYTHHVRPRTLSATGFHLASLETLGWPAPIATPRLRITEQDREEAWIALAELGVTRDARLLGIHPGARWPTRRWDPDSFQSLAERFLDADRSGVVLVTAGPGEDHAARVLASPLGGRARLIAHWPLRRFVALQSLCAAFVCGDTGPLHSAVAAGTPTLGIISRNRPAMFFPYPEAEGHRAYYARAECSPCHRDTCPDLRCLTRLTPDGAWSLLAPMLGLAASSEPLRPESDAAEPRRFAWQPR